MSALPFKVGDRIRLIHMPDDPNPIEPGTTGTILSIHQFMPVRREGKCQCQVSVKWDADRSLALIYPLDQFEVIAS